MMPTENIEVDIRGQVCPSCLLLTLREVNRHHAGLSAGQVRLEVLIDSRDATGTIPEAVSNMGFQAQVVKVDDYYRILVERAKEQA